MRQGGSNNGPGAAEPSGGKWLTKTEAAVYSRVSVATLDRAVRRGELQAGGTPGRRLFRKLWLDAWLGLFILLLLLVAVEAVDLILPGSDLGFGQLLEQATG